MNVILKSGSSIIFQSGSDTYTCMKLVLSQQLNKTDSLVFQIANNHPNLSSIQPVSSYITLTMDGDLMFEGRVIQQESDFENNVTFTCEGSLGYLLDSIQRPAEYHDTTIAAYLQDKIEKHNAQVGSDKQFTVGTVNVSNTTDNAYRIDNDYPNTLTNIQKKLVERLGGYLRVRMDGTTRYIDYVETYGKTTDQTITFGVNMLDLTKFLDSTALATRIIPLGADDSTTGLPLTIASVNSGNDYLDDTTAQSIWGIITKTVKYDDVTVASNLMTKGQADLANVVKNALTIKLKALDLSQLGVNIQSIALGDSVQCVSAPHGLDSAFTVSIRTYDFLNPDESTINLSAVLYGLTNTTVDSSARISDVQIATQRTSSTVATVAANQAKQILGAQGTGYFYFKTDDNGVVSDIYCMDTPSIETATNVWLWNKAGFSHMAGMGATPNVAITQDGVISADFIAAGTMLADRILGGTLTLGGSNNQNGVLTVKDASGNTIGTWNSAGITVNGGTITGSVIDWTNNGATIEAAAGTYKNAQNVSKYGLLFSSDNSTSGIQMKASDVAIVGTDGTNKSYVSVTKNGAYMLCNNGYVANLNMSTTSSDANISVSVAQTEGSSPLASFQMSSVDGSVTMRSSSNNKILVDSTHALMQFGSNYIQINSNGVYINGKLQ